MTSLGKTILNFKSIQLIPSIAIILSKYMNCQNEMITMMAIIDHIDGKLEMLFNYKKNDLSEVKKYFNKYSISNSDHLTIYNIYIKLFKNKIDKYLNISEFIKISRKIKSIKDYVKNINNNTYKYINNKYKVLLTKPFNNINDNILYVLCISHYFNLLIHQNNKIYKSINYLVNTTSPIEFSEITNSKTLQKYGICHNLIQYNGKQLFKCITLIPNNIIKILFRQFFNLKF